MGGAKKLHIGFPEKVIDKYLQKMVSEGYKVAVIEQTETPKMMEQRLKANKGKSLAKCVNREICQMVTKGTFKDSGGAYGYEPKYVLSYKKQGKEVGVTFFDVQTLKIYCGQFEDDEHLSNFRTLICQIRPVEIIHEKELFNSEVLKMLRNSAIPPVFTAMSAKNCWGLIKTCNSLEKFIGSLENWPQCLQELKAEDKELSIQSLGMAIAFLEDALIADTTISTSEYIKYTPETQ